jgi:hypothetical protein
MSCTLAGRLSLSIVCLLFVASRWRDSHYMEPISRFLSRSFHGYRVVRL